MDVEGRYLVPDEASTEEEVKQTYKNLHSFRLEKMLRGRGLKCADGNINGQRAVSLPFTGARIKTINARFKSFEMLMHFVQMVLNFDKMLRQINHDLQNADRSESLTEKYSY